MSATGENTSSAPDLFHAVWSWSMRRCGVLILVFSAVPMIAVVSWSPASTSAWESVHELFEGLALAFALFGLILARVRLQRDVEPPAAGVVMVLVVVAVSGAVHSAVSMGLVHGGDGARQASWTMVRLLAAVGALAGAVAAAGRSRPYGITDIARTLLAVGLAVLLMSAAVVTWPSAGGVTTTVIDSALLALFACMAAAWWFGLLRLPHGPQGEALVLCMIPIAFTIVHDLLVSRRHGDVEGAVAHYLELVALSTLLSGLLAQYSEVHRRQGEVTAELERSQVELDAAQIERDRLFAAATDLICIASTEGRFLELNPAWESTLGWTIEELKSKPFVEFVHPDDREKTLVETDNLKQQHHVTHRFLNRYARRGGGYRWLQWSATGGADENVIVAIARDVTDDREIQERLERYASDLARSNSELEQFAHVASHDLQEPLRKVQSFADLLVQRYAAEIGGEPMAYIRRMAAATERMQNLVRDLLELSRVSAIDVHDEPVDLSFTVHGVLSDLEVAIREAECSVVVAALPTVVANPRQMHQLLMNLISNAIKYRRDGVPAEIVVHAENDDDGGVVILVEDNGIGFDPRYEERIFEIFQRVSDSQHEGTGIGLALCRRIMERHGGAITATGRPGRGAVFRVRFPATRAVRQEIPG